MDQFNGNISEIHWKNAQLAEGKTYGFKYDNLNRLTHSTYAEGTGYSTRKGYFNENIGLYDLNGNIKNLTRSGNGTSSALIDNLTYMHTGNQLTSVSDGATTDKLLGFKDGNPGQDYWYDANGNLIKDLNKGISTIAYNHLNLPKLIAKGDSTIQYVYDANGTKLQKILKKGGAVIKTTNYIGDLVYEGTTDKFLNTEEGRVVLMENGQSKEEYQYHLKDHLGNVRVTFTTADRDELTNLYMATMEPEFAELEGSTFNNLETRQVDQLHNKTEGGKASARLNAVEGKAVGPSMSLKVMAGDTVRMKVFAQYHDKAKTKDAIEGMTSMVASAFTPKGAPAEAATIVAQALRQPLGGAGRLALFAKDNTIPKAYLNYLFFDKDMNYKSGGFKQVSDDGLGQFEELSLEFAPEEEGLLMVYTANQTAEDLNVYFDQMTVAHTSGPIVRVDDYYPFGMTFNTGELAGALTNKYLYNGKELQNELGVDLYDYKRRFYDPALGRFISVDPLADIAEAWTPYHFVRGNPINRIDLTGLTDFKINKETGDVAQVGEANDDPDRILKTDKDGNVKKKGEGFLGFLVSKKNRGEAKVAVGGIEQGFLSDGMNLKSEDNVFDVGGEGQPTLGGFEDFALKISNYVDKEVDGVYLSNKNETDISHVYLAGYKNNDSQNARGGFNLHKYRPDLVGNTEVRELFHTHLSRFGDSDRLRPSSIGPLGGDVGYKKRQSEYHPTLKFLIITNPKSFTY